MHYSQCHSNSWTASFLQLFFILYINNTRYQAFWFHLFFPLFFSTIFYCYIVPSMFVKLTVKGEGSNRQIACCPILLFNIFYIMKYCLIKYKFCLGVIKFFFQIVYRAFGSVFYSEWRAQRFEGSFFTFHHRAKTLYAIETFVHSNKTLCNGIWWPN